MVDDRLRVPGQVCGLVDHLLGLGGVRIEDTGMVTANGFENFTSLTRSLDPKDYF